MFKAQRNGNWLAAAICVATAVSCGAGGEEPQTMEPIKASEKSAPGFVNRVWTVTESKQVEPGQIYVFASTGALFITSPHGKPATGSWKYENGRLSIVEDVPISAEITSLTLTEMKLKISKPSPIEMTLALAPTPALEK